ncbi:hypothetical protein [Alloacidobacterium sp.]|uniref:hypothetical protein n=1 Tax=Alloacidobacterium sp. TaxID=2951999 RepID=UPI002D625C3F|nr:hypothetical protein [Alloacidobacterium sp.]HYK37609.1 hypothetical protein [Alloacidobacterium sp.]
MTPTSPRHDASLMLVEGGLTVIAIAIAFGLPRLGVGVFTRIEEAFARLARRQHLAVMTVGLTALLLRLAILPLCPIPLPFIQDDFSFLLAGDTFASGRLTNPTPVMWQHFESFQITMKPTYMSMYFPAQGVVLAAGKVLFGHQWVGILLVTALMCAAICWMLQAWLPPTWALLGGLIAVLRIGLFSYWIDTYSGGGSVAALGGALVLGALPRFMKAPRLRYGLLMAIGMVVLATSRPYEGILLCVPVLIVLARWILKGKNRPATRVLLRATAAPLLLLVAGIAWMGYYNYRVFGNPLTPPYKVNRATYAVTPYYVWQAPRPEPVYRHAVMREFYVGVELNTFNKIHSWTGFLPQNVLKCARGMVFYSGIVLLPPLIMLRRVLADRRVHFLLWCMPLLIVGMSIETFLIPHYIAPFTAAFYAIGLQAMRHLRVWKPGGQPVGMAMVRLLMTACVVLGVLRLFAVPLHFQLSGWPSAAWASTWHGPGHLGMPRAQVESELERLPGKQLAIVRYSADHSTFDDWVYNAPDIGNSKVIWAREMSEADNQELLRYYKDRKVWLVQPDLQPAGLSPYPLTSAQTVAQR